MNHCRIAILFLMVSAYSLAAQESGNIPPENGIVIQSTYSGEQKESIPLSSPENPSGTEIPPQNNPDALPPQDGLNPTPQSGDLFPIAANYFHKRKFDEALKILAAMEKINPDDPRVLSMKEYIEYSRKAMEKGFKIDGSQETTPEKIKIQANALSYVSGKDPGNPGHTQNLYQLRHQLFLYSQDQKEKTNAAMELLSMDINSGDFTQTTFYLYFLEKNNPLLNEKEKSRLYYYAGEYYSQKSQRDTVKARDYFRKSMEIFSGFYAKKSQARINDLNRLDYR